MQTSICIVQYHACCMGRACCIAKVGGRCVAWAFGVHWPFTHFLDYLNPNKTCLQRWSSLGRMRRWSS